MHHGVLSFPAYAWADGAEFRLASIQPSFTAESKQSFDPAYMKALFEVGYRLGVGGKAWARTPPEAVPVAQRWAFRIDAEPLQREP